MLKRQEYSDERVGGYEDRLTTILKAENIPFVPIRPAFEPVGISSLYSFDHLHPNDAGRKLILATVLPELDKPSGSGVIR